MVLVFNFLSELLSSLALLKKSWLIGYSLEVKIMPLCLLNVNLHSSKITGPFQKSSITIPDLLL